MGTMGRRITVGIIMVIAGAAVAVVSIWILADPPRHPLYPEIPYDVGESPKVGVAAGIMALIVGLACCCVKALEERRNIILCAILVVLVISLTSFGLAVKNRLDLKKVEDLLGALPNNPAGPFNDYSRKNTFGDGMRPQEAGFNKIFPPEVMKKLKTQLTVMAVAAGIGSLFEVVSMLIAFRLNASPASRNAMQMERSF